MLLFTHEVNKVTSYIIISFVRGGISTQANSIYSCVSIRFQPSLLIYPSSISVALLIHKCFKTIIILITILTIFARHSIHKNSNANFPFFKWRLIRTDLIYRMDRNTLLLDILLFWCLTSMWVHINFHNNQYQYCGISTLCYIKATEYPGRCRLSVQQISQTQ